LTKVVIRCFIIDPLVPISPLDAAPGYWLKLPGRQYQLFRKNMP